MQVVPTSVGTTGGSATINSNGTVEFTGVQYFAINGCFSATYRHYFVQMEWQYSFNGASSAQWRLRRLGVDRTSTGGSGYWQWLYESGGRGTMQTGPNNDAGFIPFRGNTQRNAYHMDFFNPFDNTGATGGGLVRNKMACSFSSGADIDVHDTASLCSGGTNTNDGVSFGTWSSSMTGRCSIYAYKD